MTPPHQPSFRPLALARGLPWCPAGDVPSGRPAGGFFSRVARTWRRSHLRSLPLPDTLLQAAGRASRRAEQGAPPSGRTIAEVSEYDDPS